MLIRLIYASRAKNLGPMDVKHILSSSQKNNASIGVTGALSISNGIFLQCLEGERQAVNALYHRILLDPRHTDPAILDFQEIHKRDFAGWRMGLALSTHDNEQLFLKYSSHAAFDPYTMSLLSLREFFTELQANTRWLSSGA
jgi:Sensors of blue-light using FAD